MNGLIAIPLICASGALVDHNHTAAQEVLLDRTHAFRGTSYAVSHDGTRIAVAGESLCVIEFASARSAAKCVKEMQQTVRSPKWSATDAYIAVAERRPTGVNDAVWVLDVANLDAMPRLSYESSTDGPGVTYATPDRWISDQILVIDERGRKLLLDVQTGMTIDSCGFASVEGVTTFVAAANRWFGMGHSGRVNEVQVEQRDGAPRIICTTKSPATDSHWLRFEDAISNERLLFSEQTYDRGTLFALGANLVVTNHDLQVLERLDIGSPLAISPDKGRFASIRLGPDGSPSLLITQSGHQAIMEAPLRDYDSRGLVNDFDYERLSPLWSPSGDKVLVPTALVAGRERGMRFQLARLSNYTSVQVFEDIEKIVSARWISGDRLIVEQESDTAGTVDISIYRMVE